MQKVMLIGNGGGGKTTLAYQLAARYDLPLHEIDALQFQPGWVATPATELRQTLEHIHQTERWLIDGFGPWDQIEARAQLADTIIFVDHPIWVHFWWACERQIAAAQGNPRLGGPPDCDLRDVTKRMFETIWWVHENLRPKLASLVEHYQTSKSVVWIRSPEALADYMAQLPANE
ncbi:AAA family ATPase [Herpetosiphon llansteffanensis]|uniref:AAA family ATPase n=1 Tax=Herpetosiphon llansteffanensis TaxID=2094568 RepID=UPI0013E0C539|nr:AAA family ATPase [Herpetosiphon llansteffanensis]